MSARSISDVIDGKSWTKLRTAGQPVWRNSYYKGQFENRLWSRPFDNGTVRGARKRIGAILKAAKAMERKSLHDRQKVHPGARNGKLGHVGLEVLEALYLKWLDYKTSRLDPAITTIADEIGRSYSAVHDALKKLRAAGFLHWIRRSEPTGNKEGPQVIQITNAYALDLPSEVRKLVEYLLRKPPIPDDDLQRRNQQKCDYEAMLSQLSATDWIDAIWEGDAAMGESWARIAALMDERESDRAIETGTDTL